MCFNRCKTLRGEISKLVDRNMLFDSLIVLKSAAVSDNVQEEACFPHPFWYGTQLGS